VSEKAVWLRRDCRADRISVEEVESAAATVLARWGRRLGTASGQLGTLALRHSGSS